MSTQFFLFWPPDHVSVTTGPAKLVHLSKCAGFPKGTMCREKKNALHWPNHIASANYVRRFNYYMYMFCLLTLKVVIWTCIFFLPDRPTPTFQEKKKLQLTGLFFFKF